jgi:hypothetical protein
MLSQAAAAALTGFCKRPQNRPLQAPLQRPRAPDPPSPDSPSSWSARGVRRLPLGSAAPPSGWEARKRTMRCTRPTSPGKLPGAVLGAVGGGWGRELTRF